METHPPTPIEPVSDETLRRNIRRLLYWEDRYLMVSIFVCSKKSCGYWPVHGDDPGPGGRCPKCDEGVIVHKVPLIRSRV